MEIVKTKKCSACGEVDAGEFYLSHRYRCKKCCRRMRNEDYRPSYRAKPENKALQAGYYKKWYAKNGRERSLGYVSNIREWQLAHPKEVCASIILRNSLEKGVRKRPSICSICGKEGRINAHHRDYNYPLLVDWICSSCHKLVHLQAIRL